MKKNLPADFLWGAGVNAPLSEGAFDEKGRGKSTADMLTGGNKVFPRMISPEDEPGRRYPERIGSDFYHRYDEDIALMSVCGVKAMGISISWSRLYPTGEEKEPLWEGLEYYRGIFRLLKKRGIEPIVTLFADDTPLNLAQKQDGWAERTTVKLFLRYAKRMMIEFKYYVRYWITFEHINNLMCYTGAYRSAGIILESKVFTDKMTESEAIGAKRREALHNQLLANALTVAEGHRINSQNIIGCGFEAVCLYPAGTSPRDNFNCLEYMNYANFYCADAVLRGCYGADIGGIDAYPSRIALGEDEETLKKATVDFIALRYFNSSILSADADRKKGFLTAFKAEATSQSAKGDYDPLGFRKILNDYHFRYKKPILISANGFFGRDIITEDGLIHDPERIEYISSHLEEMKNAAGDGVDIMGYMYWSAIDMVNPESGEVQNRSGLVYVNNMGESDFSRIPKDSYYWYKNYISSQAVPQPE